MIGPGKALGVLGGGHLGRMLAQAAQALGYRVHVYEPSGPSPAGSVADRETHAPYEDVAALDAFARSVDVVTCEFEDIPDEALEAVEAAAALHPSAGVLRTCQRRWREKAWIRAGGFPHARFAEALDGDIGAAAGRLGLPCVVKAADFGCDGQGQMRVATAGELAQAEAIFRGRRSILEEWVDLECEISVICARSGPGATRTFPVSENIHSNGILDLSVVPARIPPQVEAAARKLAAGIAESLGVVGLLSVEMFLTRPGGILVNGLAPRPHDSGLWSVDVGETSQFEQHVRAVCGLPLGPSGARSPVVTATILGEAWTRRGGAVVAEPDWAAVLSEPRAKLHLYGRPVARPGRRMGHFTVRGGDVEETLSLARELRARL